jgi:hypothetical protein
MERKNGLAIVIAGVLVAGSVCWAAWEVRQLRKAQDDTSALTADCAKHLGQLELMAVLEHDYVHTPMVTGKEATAGQRLRWLARTPEQRE